MPCRPAPAPNVVTGRTASASTGAGRVRITAEWVVGYDRDAWKAGQWLPSRTPATGAASKSSIPLPYLCHNDRCCGSRDGHPLYRDDNHLTETGNKVLAPMFAEVFGSE